MELEFPSDPIFLTNKPRSSNMISTVPDVIFKTRVRDESIGGDGVWGAVEQ